MFVQYDPNTIRSYAETLYRRASRIVIMSGVSGFLLSGGFGALFMSAVKDNTTGVLMFGLVGAFIGVTLGRGRALVLQLQAQTALCQVAIEANTRRAADAAVSRSAEVAHRAQVG